MDNRISEIISQTLGGIMSQANESFQNILSATIMNAETMQHLIKQVIANVENDLGRNFDIVPNNTKIIVPDSERSSIISNKVNKYIDEPKKEYINFVPKANANS